MTTSAPRLEGDLLKVPGEPSVADTLTVVTQAKKKKKKKKKQPAQSTLEDPLAVPFPDDPFAQEDPFDIVMAQAEREPSESAS